MTKYKQNMEQRFRNGAGNVHAPVVELYDKALKGIEMLPNSQQAQGTQESMPGKPSQAGIDLGAKYATHHECGEGGEGGRGARG